MIHFAIIGSGPSALYTAQALLKANDNILIDIIEKLPFPYGLVRYGVAPDHQKTKNIIRLYERVLSNTNVNYFGNVCIGSSITLDHVRNIYDAVIFATGASSDADINIPGIDKENVIGSADFVGWYNGHPSQLYLEPDLSIDTAVIIGNGNVALDCARILAKTKKEFYQSDIMDYSLRSLLKSDIKNIYIIGRRGPYEAKFTPVELRELNELTNCISILNNYKFENTSKIEVDTRVKKNIEILKVFSNNIPEIKQKRIVFNFFLSPNEILGSNKVTGIKFDNTKIKNNKLYKTGKTTLIECGLIIKALGYKVNSIKGLDYDPKNNIIKNINGLVRENIYVTGWAGNSPSGVIGTNKKYADQIALKSINEIKPNGKDSRKEFVAYLKKNNIKYFSYKDWKNIDEYEKENADKNFIRKKVVKIDEYLSKVESNNHE